MVRIDLNDVNVVDALKIDFDDVIRRKLRAENPAKTFIFLVGSYDADKKVLTSKDLQDFTNWSRSYCSQQLEFWRSTGFLKALITRDGTAGRQIIKYIMDYNTKMFDNKIVDVYLKVAKATLGMIGGQQ